MNRYGAVAFSAIFVLWFGCQTEGRDYDETSGAGGSGSTSDNTTSASTGAPVQCTTDAECTSITACSNASCDTSTGLCVYTAAPDGPNSALGDLPNDCIDYICSGGTEAAIADDTELPDPLGDCVTPSCSGGMAVYTNVAASVDCTGGVCDGFGTCVPCLADGIMNGAETDIDCGGIDAGCVPCKNGKMCSQAGDCESGECCSSCSGACVPMGSCNPC